MGSSAKTRRAAEAARTSGKMLRKGVRTIRTMTTQAATKATEYRIVSALRPLAIGVVTAALVVVGVTLLGRYQLWMSGAGLVMIAMSVLSAVHEFKHPKTVESYQDFLDKEMEKNVPKVVTVTDMSTVKTVSAKKARGSTKAAANSNLRMPKAETNALNDVSPAIMSPSASSGRRKSADLGALEAATTTVPAIADGTNATSRRYSATTTETSSTLNVLHCGTVIDIQGSHGFIIPHNLRVDSNTRAKSTSGVTTTSMTTPSAVNATSSRKNSQAFEVKMPLVIPFDLPESEVTMRQQIAVGKTVEFALSSDARAACALNVTPVPSDEEIAKSRTALRSCKQARQVSFARAMEELTIISPRDVPVEHPVDLIKYAEQLDERELPFDQFI